MTDEARALLIVAALVFGAGNSTGFVGGRVSAPVPPPEIRYVQVPFPSAEAPEPVAPPAAAPVKTKPQPAPKPKVEARPKPKPKPEPVRKPRVVRSSLPSCAVIKREYERMSYAQQMAAYARASAAEIAYGKRCLGF